MDQQSPAVVPANEGIETGMQRPGMQARDDGRSPPCAAAPARSRWAAVAVSDKGPGAEPAEGVGARPAAPGPQVPARLRAAAHGHRPTATFKQHTGCSICPIIL